MVQLENNSGGVKSLKKHDMTVSGVVFIMFCSVAAGAFGIEDMISSSGPGMTIIMLIAFSIFWALPLCLGIAEMISILPEEAGTYVWVRESLGEFWGFQMSWWTAGSYYLTNSIYVVLSVGYIEYMVDLSDTTAYILKVSIVVVFTIINLLGVREVGIMSTIFSIAVLLAFAVVCVVGAMNWTYNPFDPIVAVFDGEQMSIRESMASCFGICVWMYCGYISIPQLAGEIKDPRIMTKGILWSWPIVGLSYIVPTIFAVAAIGRWDEWAVDGNVGYSTVLTEHLGPTFGAMFLVIAIISQFSIFNASLAAGSRGFFVLADDNLSPKILVKTSKKTGVPHISILSMSIVTMLLVQFDFSTLVLAEVVFILGSYSLMAIALWRLRKKMPLEQRKKDTFTIPGGEVGMWLCVILPVSIATITLVLNGVDYFLIGLLALGTGPIAYIILKRCYGGLYKKDPKKYPINPKTKLAVGDTKRIAFIVGLAGFIGFIGSFVLRSYEAEWGPEYYLDEYGSGFLSNFDGMLNALQYGGIAVALIAVAGYFLAKKIEE